MQVHDIPTVAASTLTCMSTPATPDVPTVAFADWWPASVVLPDGRTWHRCRVYVTDAGLIIYRTRPRPGDEPSWDYQAPIDFVSVRQPSNLQAQHVGIDIQTGRGLVIVTPTGGCGCGASLKSWRPAFSRNVAEWPGYSEGVELAERLLRSLR